MQQVADSEADVVMNTVSGSGNVSLFNCLRQAEVTSDEVPTISFRVTEEELQSISGDEQDVVGDYRLELFRGLAGEDNDDFIYRLRERYGPSRVATDPMAVAYSSMYLWAGGRGQPVRSGRHDSPGDAQSKLRGARGGIELDADNRHPGGAPSSAR